MDEIRFSVTEPQPEPYCERMNFLVKDVEELRGRGPVLDVIIDGEGDALDGVLQVGLRHRRVVEEDGRARGGLLQRPARSAPEEAAAPAARQHHRPRLRQVHLAALTNHTV